MPAAAAAPDRMEASCLSPIRTAASGTPGSSPRESTSHKLRSRAISSANTRRKRRSPRSMPTRRVSRRPTGSRSWSGTTSSSGSPTLRSSGSTVRSQSARPTARPQDWRHWPRSTNTSRGAKPSPRTSTKRTATSNSLSAFMPTQLAAHPTVQNATIRRAKQRDSTSTCNTADDLGTLEALQRGTLGAAQRPKLCSLVGEVAVGGRAGRLVGELERAIGVGDRLGQAQRRGNGPAAEHLLAAAEQQRVHPQTQPVDEAETQQGLHEIEAANDMDFVVAFLHGGESLCQGPVHQRWNPPGERGRRRAAGDVICG